MSAAEQRARAVVERLPETRVVGAEVGVHDGRMSAWLLKLHERMTLWMIDNWLPGSAQPASYRATGDPRSRLTDVQAAKACLAAVEATGFAADRRAVVRADSVDASGRFRDRSIDFVFVDADHSYEGVCADLVAWSDKVKPGGLLCGHDYGDDRYDVRRAVDEYAAGRGWTVETGADGTWFATVSALAAV